LLIDSDVNDCGLDLDGLTSLIRSGAKGLILVHFGGYADKARVVAEFCRSHNIFLIEDCAHTFSSQVGDKRAGTYGDFGCFSFEEKKVMTCGDGGLLVCSEKWQADINKRKRWVGIDRDTWIRRESGDSTRSHWFYEINELGDKCNMNNYSASLGLSQIKKIERINRMRRHIISLYLEGLQDIEWVKPIFNYEPAEDRSYWLFGIRVPERDRLISHLRSAGIATGVHYTPLHMQPLFRQAQRASDMAGAEKIYSEILTLPLHCYLTTEDVQFIVDQLRSFKE
jgi:perosamine synthetase